MEDLSPPARSSQPFPGLPGFFSASVSLRFNCREGGGKAASAARAAFALLGRVQQRRKAPCFQRNKMPPKPIKRPQKRNKRKKKKKKRQGESPPPSRCSPTRGPQRAEAPRAAPAPCPPSGRVSSVCVYVCAPPGVPVPALFQHHAHAELPGKHCRRRKARTVFSDSQLSGLEKRFEIQRYLSTPERVELATALSLSETQVPGRRGPAPPRREGGWHL